MQKRLEAYIRQLLAQGFSSGTAKTRRTCLGKLACFLEKQGVEDWNKVTFQHLQAFTVSLFEENNRYGRPNSAGFRNNAVVSVKKFFEWLTREGEVSLDPALKLEFIRQPRILPRTVLSVQEMRKLLQAADKKSALGYRDRAMLELMYSSGLRNAELVGLKVQDLNLDEGMLQVIQGKGGKDRVVPLTAVAVRVLGYYVKDVRPRLLAKGGDREYLFLSCRGHRLSTRDFNFIFEANLRKAGIKKRVTPHSIRHTCATHLLSRNASLRHIQELLGHASLQSTQIYTSVSIEDLKRVHAACHPRNQDRFAQVGNGEAVYFPGADREKVTTNVVT